LQKERERLNDGWKLQMKEFVLTIGGYGVLKALANVHFTKFIEVLQHQGLL
jgi:hypothetical protein